MAGYEFRKRKQFGDLEFDIRQGVEQPFVREPQLWHVDNRSVRLTVRPPGYGHLEFVLLRVALPPALCHLSLLHAEATEFGSEWTGDRIDQRLAGVSRGAQDCLLKFNGTGVCLRFPPLKQRHIVRRWVLADMYKNS